MGGGQTVPINTADTSHSDSTIGQTRCEDTDCGDNGPDFQSCRIGTETFVGPGSEFIVDSTRPITVATQFITNDGTDTVRSKRSTLRMTRKSSPQATPSRKPA